MNKEEIEDLKEFKENLKNMTQEEIIGQLEWSDTNEFSYFYAYYLLEENQKLEEKIDIGKEQYNDLVEEVEKLEEENQELKVDYGTKAQVERDLLVDRINKATNFIRETKYCDIDGLNKYHITDFWFVKEIDDILKGVNND